MGDRFQERSFRLLLYLEWILLGIAIIAALSIRHPPPLMPSGGGLRPGPPPPRDLPWAVLGCIVVLGGLGLRLPTGSLAVRILYTIAGFSLSWLTVSLGGRGNTVFSALLLVVVLRACVLFPWRGRIVTAIAAYGGFVLLLWRRVQHFAIRGDRLGRSLDTLQQQQFLTSLTINAALLYGLVLLFVMLLVGAVLSERESREALLMANTRLRRYALLIENQAMLQERSRIAREMHDSVGHALTAQSIQLENAALSYRQGDPEQGQTHLSAARQLGKDALRDVRQSVASLQTSPLQGRSLPQAVQALADNFTQTTQIPVDVAIAPLKTIPPELSTALYRLVQEALTNITRYSAAAQVQITLTAAPGQISLTIADNGQGFDQRQNTTGFGLRSMRDRIEAIGGQFQIHSEPGQGCTIRALIPR
ncbi:sensor histidine kinase [Spirulina major CS-329]|uniref:sensor histidine kinase n=1 Tax=Spirulina TaxID=1154 RepID=UPI00232E0F02|nr:MULTISPECIES: sensor histidine kinase [Spirulina]MDB9496936.1 sensor histidine kinase [Spirulina subsalsa CS-330]MDB9501767.1 sensor histidine kinase [Spirulina major CS-329]